MNIRKCSFGKLWSIGLMIIAISFSSVAQTDERWDKETGVYSNFEYGYTINLSSPLEWKRTTGNALHTSVKFENVIDGTIFFVNVIPMKQKTEITAWDVYEEVKTAFNKQKEYTKKTIGVEFISDSFEKVIFRGIKSLKATSVYKIESDELETPLIVEQVSYSLIRNNSTFTIGVKAIFKSRKDSQSYLRKIFSGFGLVHTRSEIERSLQGGL